MTARAFEIGGPQISSSASRLMRYRLDVIAGSVADVVGAAGGWLFDRVMAGWEVNLRLSEPVDARPLKILGINTVECGADWSGVQAIAVSADMFNSHKQTRQGVVKVLERGLTEVTVWGDPSRREFHRHVDAVQHQLSAAARAFKAQALSAADLSQASVTGVERFRRAPRRDMPYEPDLMPIR